MFYIFWKYRKTKGKNFFLMISRFAAYIFCILWFCLWIWVLTLILLIFKKARNNVVLHVSVNEASSIVVDEPAGNVFSSLQILPEVSLPASEDPKKPRRKVHIFKHSHIHDKYYTTNTKWKHLIYLVTLSFCPFTYIVASGFSGVFPGYSSVTSYWIPW